MDPFSAMAILSGLLTAGGTAYELYQRYKKYNADKKAGKAGIKNPIEFSNAQVTALKRLPQEQQDSVNKLILSMTTDPDAFLGELEPLEKSGMLQEISKQLPTQQELGFPQSAQDTISNLLGQTEFGPQEEYARRQFEQRTIPGIAERFAGQGALNSSAFQGQLGQAASDLESKLAALRSDYGLKRANILGPMQQKQQALDLGQAQAARQLGLAERGQRFGEQQALANLGLQERAQELQKRGLGAGLLPSLLGSSAYQFLPNQQAGLGQQLIGTGLAGGGIAAQLYGQNQLYDLMKNLNAAAGSGGTT